ncbi:HD-GYP domain-containing protein [Ensifer canadensis]
MRKRIRRHQVRLGMFVEELEGGAQAALRGGFLLSTELEVDRVRTSNVISVLINVQKGCDIAGPTRRAPPLAHAALSTITAAENRAVSRTIDQTKHLLAGVFTDVRLGGTVALGQAEEAVEKIASAVEHNPIALIGISRLKKKDEYTFLHSIAVSGLMVHFGRWLKLDERSVQILGLSGLLHDIGKLLLPKGLLNKTDRLDDQEIAQIRTHTRRGYDLLSANGDVHETVLDVCLHHHEHVDGGGYPDRLRGEQLSMPVRIAAICDVYDAMTTLRPYKRAWTPAETVQMMFGSKGHFDRALLTEFVESLEPFLRLKRARP